MASKHFIKRVVVKQQDCICLSCRRFASGGGKPQIIITRGVVTGKYIPGGRKPNVETKYARQLKMEKRA